MNTNKKMIVISFLIILLTLLYFFGGNFYYYLKYKISPAIKIVYSEQNVSIDNYPNFIKKVDNIAKTKWYSDARLSFIETTYHTDGNYVSQTLHYYSDSHKVFKLTNFIEKMIIKKDLNQSDIKYTDNLPQELSINYNYKLQEINIDPETDYKLNFNILYKVDNNNSQINATALKDYTLSSVYIVNEAHNLNINEFVISPLDAIKIIKNKYNSNLEFKSLITNKEENNNYYWNIFDKNSSVKYKVNTFTGDVAQY